MWGYRMCHVLIVTSHLFPSLQRPAQVVSHWVHRLQLFPTFPEEAASALQEECRQWGHAKDCDSPLLQAPDHFSVPIWHGWGPPRPLWPWNSHYSSPGYLELHFTHARCPLPKWSLLPTTFTALSTIPTPKKSYLWSLHVTEILCIKIVVLFYSCPILFLELKCV